jgi:hypothetical protein
MKEQYRKPLIFFESFSLAQTIAKNCGDTHQSTLGESNHYDAYTCEWDVGGFTLFFDHCDYPMDEDEQVEGICYNNPDGGQSVFSST